MIQGSTRESLLQNFPVNWENPDDKKRFWLRDFVHAPRPFVPMEQFVTGKYIAEGIGEGFPRYSIPLGIKLSFFNNYFFRSASPLLKPKEELEEILAISEDKCEEAAANIPNLWDKEWLPELQKQIELSDAFELATASDEELKEHFVILQERVKQAWHIHHEVVSLFIVTISQFEEFYANLFKPENIFEPFELLDGLRGDSVDCEIEVWKLSQYVANNPELKAIFQENKSNEVVPELKKRESATDFLKKLDGFLVQHGKKNEHPFGLPYPTWLEDPAPVILSIQMYLNQPEFDLEKFKNQKQQERENKIQETRKKLMEFPESFRQKFEVMLEAAARATMLIEDHNYWIEHRNMFYPVRMALAEIGKRLVAKDLIHQADDVYFLVPDEVKDLLTFFNPGNTKYNIQQRRSFFELSKTLDVPRVIGQKSTNEKSIPLESGVKKVVGWSVAKQSDEPNARFGKPCAPGKVVGKAVVALTREDALRLEPGDILVAPGIGSCWIPFLTVAAGVVMEAGGIHSAAAFLAREHEIPAVSWVSATEDIKDGQQIEIDGNTGKITIL